MVTAGSKANLCQRASWIRLPGAKAGIGEHGHDMQDQAEPDLAQKRAWPGAQFNHHPAGSRPPPCATLPRRAGGI
jgi:hypothetical protein